MPVTIEARLAELGIELPVPSSPVANFVPCVQSGGMLFVSGQISSWNGELRHIGKVGREISVREGKTAARLCALNLIAQVKAWLGRLDRVHQICMLRPSGRSVRHGCGAARTLRGWSGITPVQRCG